MDIDPITHLKLDEPMPSTKPGGRPAKHRETMFDLLGTMESGQGIEVNRGKRSLQYYVQRFRRVIEPSARFMIRGGSGKWSKIWRVQ
jgi:hypothetical protein